MGVQLHFHVKNDGADFPYFGEFFGFGYKFFLLIIHVHSSIALQAHRFS